MNSKIGRISITKGKKVNKLWRYQSSMPINTDLNLKNYSRVSNRRDSLRINYSIFCHPPQPYSALLVNFGEFLPAFPFIPDSLFINLRSQSTAVA